MTRHGWRGKLVEEKMVNRIDRGRQEGYKGNLDEKGVVRRLHECAPGDWVRQVMKGAGNYGQLLRVIDPRAGILETRQGAQVKLSPRTQVEVRP